MPGGWLLSVHQGCHTQIGCHKLQKFFSESPGQQSKTEVSAGLGCLSLLRAGHLLIVSQMAMVYVMYVTVCSLIRKDISCTGLGLQP